MIQVQGSDTIGHAGHMTSVSQMENMQNISYSWVQVWNVQDAGQKRNPIWLGCYPGCWKASIAFVQNFSGYIHMSLFPVVAYSKT